ncbi:putative RNA-directed DNA polymerase from transposon X-element [Portunus trituberculatus]|uniref:Putative RNA-directed DNA polymerase from transposon X-element n=1 Tax=Portunus trituberculatus TaxID=210409 RepID=A0A5B7I3Z5_PORTR|nr:putative RNA-directed DNA polymerase from transposon X-element [Portunus trituberculatus]
MQSNLRRHRGDPQFLDAFRRCRSRARRVFNEAQRASWKAHVSSINARTPLTDVFNKVRRIAGKYSAPAPPVLLSAGQTVADPKTVADLFAEHFASVSRKDPAAPGARNRQRIFLPLEWSPIISPSLPPSCGLLCPSVMTLLLIQTTFLMRHMSDRVFNFLSNLYNMIWHTGDFPFPKPGKDNLKAANYRSISLTSCICKVLEKMVNVRFMWYLERGNYFSSVQYGFQKMRSTTDALLSQESSICEALTNHHYQVTFYFDLEKDYDTAWCHGILRSLYNFGLRGHLPIFIQQFLSRLFYDFKWGVFSPMLLF